MKKIVTTCIVLMCLSVLIPGFIFAEANPKYLRFPISYDPPTMDPGHTADGTSLIMQNQLFTGLVNYNTKTLEPIPALATHWEASADMTSYTFYLRKDVKWTNGKSVTAHDVVWAIRRNINPKTASRYAFALYILKNGFAINKGKETDITKIGVTALDNYTLKFDLVGPAGYFPALAGVWTYKPLPRETIEKHGDKWLLPKNIVSNGPYNLTEWIRDSKITFIKNPDYYDAANVAIPEVRIYVIPESSTAITMYENDEVDVLGIGTAIPSAELPRIKKDPVLSKEFNLQPHLATEWIGFNNERAPVDNRLVRKAIASVIDRELIITQVRRNNHEPAYTFTRPPIFGAVPAGGGVGIKFNPEQGRKWLAEAGYPNGKGFPTITYMYETSENNAQVAQAIQALLKQHLNINIRLENQERKVFLKTTTLPDTPHMFRRTWGADYPDADNFLRQVFHPKESINRIRWKNKEFGDVTNRAQVSTDKEERIRLYRRAEQILCEEQAAMIPLAWTRISILVKSRIDKWEFPPVGGTTFRTWSFK